MRRSRDSPFLSWALGSHLSFHFNRPASHANAQRCDLLPAHRKLVFDSGHANSREYFVLKPYSILSASKTRRLLATRHQVMYNCGILRSNCSARFCAGLSWCVTSIYSLEVLLNVQAPERDPDKRVLWATQNDDTRLEVACIPRLYAVGGHRCLVHRDRQGYGYPAESFTQQPRGLDVLSPSTRRLENSILGPLIFICGILQARSWVSKTDN